MVAAVAATSAVAAAVAVVTALAAALVVVHVLRHRRFVRVGQQDLLSGLSGPVDNERPTEALEGWPTMEAASSPHVHLRPPFPAVSLSLNQTRNHRARTDTWTDSRDGKTAPGQTTEQTTSAKQNSLLTARLARRPLGMADSNM